MSVKWERDDMVASYVSLHARDKVDNEANYYFVCWQNWNEDGTDCIMACVPLSVRWRQSWLLRNLWVHCVMSCSLDVMIWQHDSLRNCSFADELTEPNIINSFITFLFINCIQNINSSAILYVICHTAISVSPSKSFVVNLPLINFKSSNITLSNANNTM